MQLTNQTINVAEIRYSLDWRNAPTSDNWDAYFTVGTPVGEEGANFLDNADDLARAWKADVLSGYTYTSSTLTRTLSGVFSDIASTVIS